MVDIILTLTWEDAWRARFCSHCGCAPAAAALSRCDNRDRACGKPKRKVSRLKLKHYRCAISFFLKKKYVDFVQWSLPVYLDHISPSFWPSDPYRCGHWPCHLWNERPTRYKLRFLRPIEKCVACVERLLIQNVALSSTAPPVRQHGHSHHLEENCSQDCDPVGVQFHHSSCFLIW